MHHLRRVSASPAPYAISYVAFSDKNRIIVENKVIKDLQGRSTIRGANADDANLIAVLGSATFYEAYFEQDIPSALANYILDSFSPAQIRQEMEEPGSEFLILFLDEKAVGYAKLRQDPPAPGVSSRNSIELQRFYLVERVWGTGLAEKLLENVLGRAGERGFDTLWLGVWTENKRARKFYEKHGFTDTGGRLEFVYDAGIGINIVMERSLYVLY